MWFVAAPAYAQTTDWQELRTQRFAILYTPDQQATAQQYAKFVDGLYDEVAAVFGHRTATPVTLRLYPTLNSYYDANPLARGLTGVVAHADYRRHEVVVILDQTVQQTPDEVENNVRHEMTHIVASDLSESRLNVMFQEGLAQYVEHPSPELENKIGLLRSVVAGSGLLNWSDMNDRDTFYRLARVSYPESLSIVAFLVDRYSFAKVREMLTVTAQSNGYRSALERTFGVSPDQLEKEWQAWLPSYLAGGYKRNALVSYDLSKAQSLLAEGRYADAQHELETAVEWLRTASQPQVLQQAETLLEQSLAAQRAESVAGQARAALEAADFARAQELTAQAQQAYAAVGDTRQDAVLQEYAARAARGLAAENTLETAQQLSATWHVLQARALADQAAADFAAVGATQRVAEARAVREVLDQRQSLVGIVLLALGAAGVVVSAVRSLTMREAEAW
jgi:hypothetical protein